jgi:hypothetical protein
VFPNELEQVVDASGVLQSAAVLVGHGGTRPVPLDVAEVPTAVRALVFQYPVEYPVITPGPEPEGTWLVDVAMALTLPVAITNVDAGVETTVETSAGLVAAAAAAPATVVVLTTSLNKLHMPLTKFTATQPSVVSHCTRHALMSGASIVRSTEPEYCKPHFKLYALPYES